MIQIVRFFATDTELIERAFAVRRKVFVDEQGVDASLEYDEFETSANHYLLYYNAIAVGAARWRKTSYGIKLERFAVLNEYRGKGFGDMLVKRVLDDVRLFGVTIYLHSQLKACGLYRRNGFVEEGAIFMEAGIEHYKMAWKQS
ncbi:MAG: GNAT family N-acetyltransferase [Bacteroidota bacterium]